MENLRLALDWTPNVNHIGFFVAWQHGFYRELGLDVEITDPSIDNYQITPAKKVELWRADLALCPTESIFSYRTKAAPFDLTAIGSVYENDVSAIVVREDSGIERPKDLDGKRYASYNARYEDAIVRQMIRNDGGEGNIEIVNPDKLGIWDTILNETIDATWIFDNWEGVQAEQRGVRLRKFRMADYHIPYSYSPVIVCSAKALDERPDAFRKFMEATRRGFVYAMEHQDEAAALLSKRIPSHDEDIDLKRAVEVSAAAMSKGDNWGRIDLDVVETFLDWIYRHKLEEQVVRTEEIIRPL